MTTKHRTAVSFLAFFLGSLGLVSAQDKVTIPLTDPSQPVTLKASLLTGSITVKASSGREVVVEARTREHDSGGESGGRHRIAINATGLSAEEEDNHVEIGAETSKRAVDIDITVPVRTSLVLRSVNDGDISVTGVSGELDVENINGSVTLTDVSGAAVAHALNGRVLVNFKSITPGKPMAFSSLNGDIEVTFPPDLKANVSIYSGGGEVYSDFEIQMKPQAPQQVEGKRDKRGRYAVKFDKTVRGTIAGGGPEIQFKNFQGDIYIKKAGK
jgi:DUF4097 and DUF4098 domain-containing protein YvlB